MFFYWHSHRYAQIQSAICVPIIQNDDPIALVYAYKTAPAERPFDQNDGQLAVAVSHQVALAIQRAHILDEAKILEKWAYTDSLPGLRNRRHLEKAAQTEFERSKQFQHPFAMLMMDVDNFKTINDTYGHLVGDQILIGIAQRLNQSISEKPIETSLGPISNSVSIGAATINSQVQTLEALFSLADKALYAAKKRGKNQIETIQNGGV